MRDGQWFFFANDIEHLKPLLDRVNGRVHDAKSALATDDLFVAAGKRMPSSYAALAYARLDRFVEKLLPLADKTASASASQMTMVRQLRTFCGATSFAGGKIRDTIFVGMPRFTDAGELARASLSVGTKDTFSIWRAFLI